MIRANGRAVTTNYVLAELAALMISPLRLPHTLRVDVIHAIRHAQWVEVVHMSPELDDRSWRFMAKYRDKTFSLVDCSSFIVMKDYGLFNALTSDRHFEQAGFVQLLRPH